MIKTTPSDFRLQTSFTLKIILKIIFHRISFLAKQHLKEDFLQDF